MSSFGQAPPRYVESQEAARAMSERYRDCPVIAEFYTDLAKQFDDMIQHGLKRDEELLDG